jgi:long-chain acyl-CoA synthetase
MHPARHAETHPDKIAYVMGATGEAVTYKELNDRSNQVAQLLRVRGVGVGDVIAIFMDNNARFLEIAWAAQRAGLYYACISSKLTAGEVEYIVKDCGAKMLFTSAAMLPVADELVDLLPDTPKLMVGGVRPGYESYEAARDAMPAVAICDETSGTDMLYSSGTTGRPKGVKMPLSGAPIDADNPLRVMTNMLYKVTPDTVYLSPAPLYHAAPLRWVMALQRTGGSVVVMEKFDPIDMLRLVESHRVTTMQVVPTMFIRLLKMPEAERKAYDLSSLVSVIHAAAPCPTLVKEQMIDWLGPIVYEYYAGTESNGFCTLNSEEWLTHKGSVGRSIMGTVKICNDEGEEVPVGEEGTIYFADGPVFEYHNDPKKTAESRHPRNPTWSTLGDVGKVDADGYVYLTDRKAFMIISGGVNIYPQEIENLIVTHPKVADVAVFGVPNEDFGEEVKAVVQPMSMDEAGEELAGELMEFCRQHLSPVKRPRSIDFEAELPRHPTGKLYKRLLRDRYWGNRESRIV